MKSGKLQSHALNGNWAKNLYFLEIDVDADGSGASGIAIKAPWKLAICDIIVECRVAEASGTLQVRTGTTAISDAIICAVDKVIDRAGTIDVAQSTIAKDGNINAIAAGGTAANIRGLVTLVCKRLGD